MNVEVLEAKKITILNSVFDSAELVAGDIRYSEKNSAFKGTHEGRIGRNSTAFNWYFQKKGDMDVV